MDLYKFLYAMATTAKQLATVGKGAQKRDMRERTASAGDTCMTISFLFVCRGSPNGHVFTISWPWLPEENGGARQCGKETQ